MHESDDDVRDLHAGVVDVILHFDAPPGAAQHAHQRIAQRGVAQVADVRGLVGIDVGVFDDAFGRVGEPRPAGVGVPHPSRRPREKRRAKNKDSRSPPPATSTRSTPSIGGKLRGDFLRDLPRSALQALGQLEADGRGDFAHLDAGRPLRDDGDILAVVLANMRREGGANAGFENVIHVAPICKEKQ